MRSHPPDRGRRPDSRVRAGGNDRVLGAIGGTVLATTRLPDGVPLQHKHGYVDLARYSRLAVPGIAE